MRTRVFLLLLIVSGLCGASHLLPASEQAPGSPRPEVVWSVERRDLPARGWRHRVAVGRDGTVWIGTDLPLDKEGGGLLHRKEGTTWSSFRVLPPETQRTFVLDTDPEGGLWVAPFHPEIDNRHPQSSYRTGLRIQHHDGRRWREERAPGFWPQAMDMISPEEGWIGGNHGMLLHRSAGRWTLEKLPGNASQLAGRNILALEMRSPDEGWAAGTLGLVAHWHGGRWRIQRVPPSLATERFFDLDVTEDGHLWLAGTNGVIAHYDGKVWTQIFRPTIFDLLGIDMVSPSDGWAVGEQGTLLRYDGTTWSPQPTPVPGLPLRSIVMTSAEEGWIAGDQVVLHAHAASTAWQAPRFQDQSRWAGYSMAGKPSDGASVLDVDADGDLDLFSVGEGGLRLYLQEGPRRFSESSRLPLLAASPQEGMRVEAWAWGDVEGDGDRDLVLWGAPFGLQLLRNAGRGVFATAEKLRSEVRPEPNDAAFFLDLDRDRWMDLYLARGHWPPNWIYRNQGDRRFQLSRQDVDGDLEDPTAQWGDLDGDLDPDLLLTGEANRLILLRNDGTGGFQEDSDGSGLQLPVSWGRTFQSIFVDLDRDGDLDVLLLGSGLVAFLNDGQARFRRDSGLLPNLVNDPYHGGFLTAGDLNHDGFPEILVQTARGNRLTLHLLSRNPASSLYSDITNGSGLEGLGGRSAVFSDLDGDGDLDLYLARREGSLVLENTQNDANFLKVHLHGDRGNRAAAGAQVWIYEVGRRDGGALRGYQQMGAGFSPSAQQNLSELHFGLDASRRYDVEVLFPSGRRMIERCVQAGRAVEIFESPPVIRQGVLILRWAQRAWLNASRPLEIAKLAFVILALVLWRGPVARRFEARLLVPRWSLLTGLLVAYLAVAGELAAERRAAPHTLQLLGFCGTLALLAGLDARLSRWKYQHFLGPFVLEKTLGQGGMGVVHRARHALTGQIVALKVLHPRWIDREDLRLHFLRETQVLTRFDHPNIVRVFETGAVGDRGYISMELLKGMPLSSYIQREGPLSPEIVVELLLAACDALAHVHAAGFVHGDVKSANLFLLEPDDLARSVEQGWRPRIKLMDFGLAQRIGAEAIAFPASLGGTPAYMSPEQLQRRPLDARSDLYSLGVVAYEALTGQMPFEGDREGSLPLRIQAGELTPLRQRRPEVSRPLERTLSKLLAVSREDRPASAAELGVELRMLRQNDDSGALPASSPLAAAFSWEEAATWQNLFREAKSGLAQGRIIEGQVLILECLAALGESLHQLSDDDREAYCQRHEEIAEALELHRRLSQGQGMQL